MNRILQVCLVALLALACRTTQSATGTSEKAADASPVFACESESVCACPPAQIRDQFCPTKPQTAQWIPIGWYDDGSAFLLVRWRKLPGLIEKVYRAFDTETGEIADAPVWSTQGDIDKPRIEVDAKSPCHGAFGPLKAFFARKPFGGLEIAADLCGVRDRMAEEAIARGVIADRGVGYGIGATPAGRMWQLWRLRGEPIRDDSKGLQRKWWFEPTALVSSSLQLDRVGLLGSDNRRAFFAMSDDGTILEAWRTEDDFRNPVPVVWKRSPAVWPEPPLSSDSSSTSTVPTGSR